MGQYIVKLGRRYLIWSTVTDAPSSYGMTLTELHNWIFAREGREGLASLPERLERVDLYGTSCIQRESPDEAMWLNRAGRNETALTKAQIIEHYVKRNTPEEELPIGAPNPVFPDDEAERDPWTLEKYLGKPPKQEPEEPC